jgi:hypothetical protein
MKQSMGYGPMNVGEGLPKTPRGMDESSEGTVMNPGDTAGVFSKRTAGKFKSFRREPVPRTPIGRGGGESKPE